MLDKLENEIGRVAPVAVQDQRDRAHADRVERHPRRGVRLLERLARLQMRPVDGPDVVEPEEAALEDVRAVGVLAVDPPREVDEQLVEDPVQERDVLRPVDGEDLEGCPRLDRRVHVVERPLVGRDRSVRVLEPLPTEQGELVLGEGRINASQRLRADVWPPQRRGFEARAPSRWRRSESTVFWCLFRAITPALLDLRRRAWAPAAIQLLVLHAATNSVRAADWSCRSRAHCPGQRHRPELRIGRSVSLSPWIRCAST